VLELLVLSLATYRLANIVYEERIAEPLRKLVGYDGISYPDTWLGYLFNCFRCLSVWSAAVTLVLYIYAVPLVWILAASAIALLIKERLEG
jgi:hypothetical protein